MMIIAYADRIIVCLFANEQTKLGSDTQTLKLAQTDRRWGDGGISCITTEQ